MILSFFHLSTLWLIGFLFITLLWPGRFLKDLLLKLMLAAGLGPGIDACIYFLVMTAAGPDITILRWIELVLLLLLGSLVIYRFFPLRRSPIELPAWPKKHEWPLLGLFGILLCAIFAAFFFYSQVHPSGTFDAYAIWNLKARLIFRDPQNWVNTFNPEFDWKTHPDYPLLIPMNVLRLWQRLGNESVRAAAALAAGYTFALVGLVFAFIRRQRGFNQAALGGILLLATPALLIMGTAQTSDLPLAYYILAASILLYLAIQEGYAGFTVLAGMMTGLGVWTKNDGAIFFIATILICLAFWFKQPRRLTWFGLGLVLPLVTTLVFKLIYAPPGDMIAGQTLSEILSRTLEFKRYPAILASLIKNIGVIGSFQLPILALLSVAAWVYQRRYITPDRHAYRFLWALAGLTMFGYCAVYVITPHSLEWHLTYSMNRLVMHVYPLGLALMVMAKYPSSKPAIHASHLNESLAPNQN